MSQYMRLTQCLAHDALLLRGTANIITLVQMGIPPSVEDIRPLMKAINSRLRILTRVLQNSLYWYFSCESPTFSTMKVPMLPSPCLPRRQKPSTIWESSQYSFWPSLFSSWARSLSTPNKPHSQYYSTFQDSAIFLWDVALESPVIGMRTFAN